VTPIRPATPADVPQLHELIRELANFERAPDAVVSTPDDLHSALFGGDHTPHGSPAAYAFVVDNPDDAPGLAAMAIYVLNYSTWLGKYGIYLEDLYVRPQFRGRGFGRALLATLAREAVDRGYGRVEWSVLDWNTPAWDFYRTQGAEAMTEWTVHRVSGAALTALAQPATDTTSIASGR